MSNAKVVNGPMQVIAQSGTTHRNLTIASVAAPFIGTALNANTSHVYWTLAGADMRMTIDGTNPTASDGHIIKDGNSGIWSKTWAESARVIAVSGSGIFTISELNYL
jgi:hypothetical protein